MRPPPSQIQILMPVWGGRHVEDFLAYCLPSLLAPGNVPALAGLAPCTFVLMAPRVDADAITRHPLWAKLAQACTVQTVPLDDLVSQSSSTVLTLAYASAIRAVGPAMLETCFLPLVSDYVLADGSLAAVARAMFAGASGVLAGNYQMVVETAGPWLDALKDSDGVLSVPPRQLVDLSLRALHPATLASVVGAGRTAPGLINRLFWRVDERCMIGRFYLMHMIALRPEKTEFVISAPSDYSLIPELCPSGAIVRMTDSDDYCVVECQPRRGRSHTSRVARFDAQTVAAGLAQWATADHRENAAHVVVYHADDASPGLDAAIAASGAFIDAVRVADKARPQPSRNHPVWPRTMQHHTTTAFEQQDPERIAEITGDPSIADVVRRSGEAGAREKFLGRAPDFRRWHPRWGDAEALRENLVKVAGAGSLVIVSDAPARVRSWLDAIALGAGAARVAHMPSSALAAGRSLPLGDRSFDAGLMLVSHAGSQLPEQAARAIAAFVKPDGRVMISVGSVFADQAATMLVSDLPGSGEASSKRLTLETADLVPAGRFRVSVQTTMMAHARAALHSAGPTRLFWAASAGGLAICSFFCNRVLARRGRWTPGGRASSYTLTFRRIASVGTVNGIGLGRPLENGRHDDDHVLRWEERRRMDGRPKSGSGRSAASAIARA